MTTTLSGKAPSLPRRIGVALALGAAGITIALAGDYAGARCGTSLVATMVSGAGAAVPPMAEGSSVQAALAAMPVVSGR